jgi:hypothetical protein
MAKSIEPVRDRQSSGMAVQTTAASQSFVDDPFLRRIDWVAHSKINDVNPIAPLAVLELVDAPEEIPGQIVDSRCHFDVITLGRLMVPGAGLVLGSMIQGLAYASAAPPQRRTPRCLLRRE